MVSRRSLLLLGVLALGCKGSPGSDARTEATGASVTDRPAKILALNGAGATLPYPLYSKWIAEYARLHSGVRINYQSIGSGGGVRQILAETVDFGASDVPLREAEALGAKDKLVHIPTTIGAVAISYNLKGLSAPLKLTPDSLSGIFLGVIKKWNDERLRVDNPDARLPDQDIAVIVRTDGSGTTAVFTGYLAGVSRVFEEQVGVGKSVKWPVGLGAKGNEGVTGLVKTTEGAIGYLELAYATQNHLATAQIRNKAGRFVGPSPAAATAAAEGVELGEELHVPLADAEGEGAYPLASYTYLLVYRDAKDPGKGEALARFIWWALHDGQKYAKDLDYAPLPANIVSKVEVKLRELEAGGRRLLDGV